jgi:putative hydrolase of the HAD superfamily
MTTFPERIHAVVFDAVGTLIRLDPSAGDVYAEFAARFGSRLDAGEIRRRFGVAFAAQERIDRMRWHRTDEGRERERWRQIVGEVIDDIDDPPRCFQALYDHFTLPSAWQCDTDSAHVLASLKRRGFVVGMASNFDHRLRPIAAGLPDLALLDHLWISSEIGWKKPAIGFFGEVRSTLGLAPAHVLFVGDDLTNDYTGALAAGMSSLLLDPCGRADLPAHRRIARLGELLALDDLASCG